MLWTSDLIRYVGGTEVSSGSLNTDMHYLVQDGATGSTIDHQMDWVESQEKREPRSSVSCIKWGLLPVSLSPEAWIFNANAVCSKRFTVLMYCDAEEGFKSRWRTCFDLFESSENEPSFLTVLGPKSGPKCDALLKMWRVKASIY